MATFLQQAEQQGLVDVFVVTLTRQEWLSMPRNRIGYSKSDKERDAVLNEAETTIENWRRLDGKKPGWAEEEIDTDKGDCILQVNVILWTIQQPCVYVSHNCKKGDFDCQPILWHVSQAVGVDVTVLCKQHIFQHMAAYLLRHCLPQRTAKQGNALLQHFVY